VPLKVVWPATLVFAVSHEGSGGFEVVVWVEDDQV
jgi:hypothetical protein